MVQGTGLAPNSWGQALILHIPGIIADRSYIRPVCNGRDFSSFDFI